MSGYKSSREVIKETGVNENNVEVARAEGIMEGIITTSKMLGITDLYSKTITNLRFAIQEEKKEHEERQKE